MTAPPLPQGCPWSEWMPPNLKWCEENLCQVVTAPANTWSNLAYLGIGIVMWWQARKLGRRDLVFYGPATIVMGAFSLAYHASYTFFFQFFDFVGMFVFLDLMIVMDLQRLDRLKQLHPWSAWLLLVVVSSALVPLFFFAGIPIQLLVAGTVPVWLWLEGSLLRERGGSRALLVTSLALAMLALLFSASDVTGVFCDPTDHIVQGHAIWHLLSACAFYALFLHHVQLPERRLRGPLDPGVGGSSGGPAKH
ncbi:ceramidase [Myxococcota bacterium]|nr:ceramidase [Myxococcota bacterium]